MVFWLEICLFMTNKEFIYVNFITACLHIENIQDIKTDIAYMGYSECRQIWKQIHVSINNKPESALYKIHFSYILKHAIIIHY